MTTIYKKCGEWIDVDNKSCKCSSKPKPYDKVKENLILLKFSRINRFGRRVWSGKLVKGRKKDEVTLKDKIRRKEIPSIKDLMRM